MVCVTSHNQPPNNGIQCARKCCFHTRSEKIKKISPRSVALLPSFGPPLTNCGCTTVTGIAKGHKGSCSPLNWNKINFVKGENGIGICHLTYPLIMAFNVQENVVFIHEFSKNLPTVTPRRPLLPTLPPLGRFAPSLCPPLLKNPGYASANQ